LIADIDLADVAGGRWFRLQACHPRICAAGHVLRRLAMRERASA
jgi:hypothetical protein